jgi:hypothetical protein
MHADPSIFEGLKWFGVLCGGLYMNERHEIVQKSAQRPSHSLCNTYERGNKASSTQALQSSVRFLHLEATHLMSFASLSLLTPRALKENNTDKHNSGEQKKAHAHCPPHPLPCPSLPPPPPSHAKTRKRKPFCQEIYATVLSSQFVFALLSVFSMIVQRSLACKTQAHWHDSAAHCARS